MSERVKFIACYLEAEETFSDLCDEFGVSRKTGYKWLERYKIGGVNALTDQSRAPRSHPHAVSEEIIEEILRVRARHPRWGPRKLIVVVARHNPEWNLPAASTVGEMLKRKGLVSRRPRRRRNFGYRAPLSTFEGPNGTWCADFKGHFPVGGKRCHPLTISDGFSRYLLCCKAQKRPYFQATHKTFEAVFREYGLPKIIRTDNGAPFSTLAVAGLSRLAIWWIRLGILPERIETGSPQQNGRHERMHRTLKAETAKPPRSSLQAQQRAFDKFRKEYNHERPHEAIRQAVPASLYEASPRKYPKVLPEPDYPSHFKTALAYPNGVISFEKTQWFLAGCLANELVGLEQINEDCWKVYFGPIALGLLDIRTAKERGYRQFGILVPTQREVIGRTIYR